jgi:2-polyprenyl-3-methyl-5-hydroxy-6-metoxy-1,4-benzoquinol methylase
MHPEYGRHYRELYEKHWWWRAREELLVDELRRRFSPAEHLSILDVGCGDGLFFDRLAEFGDVQGIEPAGALVDPLGKHRSRITIAPFDSGFRPGRKFDLILFLDVLEHLNNPQQALQHALLLLAPGGVILITVPAFRLLWTRHDLLNEHVTRFTKSTFLRLAKSANMEVIEQRYFFIWLFAAKLLTRMRESIASPDAKVPSVPARAINRALFLLSRLEEKVTRILPAPVGSSLLVVGKKGNALENLHEPDNPA